MKKIIYSIVTALMLSIILALILPTWFLREDARWTYLANSARVDVSFSGHLKNGRVIAEGADSRITQPTWLSNENYQGTVVELPISYRQKAYQIKLTPQAKEWGTNATLLIKFRGEDLQHRGVRKPAWVCFRNILLNGQPIAAEKLVWHDQHFLLKCPHLSSEITLTFDVCKPLATSDVSFVNLLALFFACLLLSFFFAPLKQVADRVLTFLNRKDISCALKDSYLRIDPAYRHSFWIIFGVLCFAFGFHTICFMWGNHDWSLLDSQQRWLSLEWCGRYMINAIKIPLSKGVYLPLIYDLLIFITLAVNAVLLCKYWRLEKRVVYFVLCGLVLTAQPFTLCMVYYVHMTPEVFIGVTCVLAALLLSEKIAWGRDSITKKILYSAIAIILVNFSLAMYPVLLNTIAVVFVGRLLVQSFDWDGSGQQLKSYMNPCMITAAIIILGVASYKLAVTYIFPMDHYAYNTGTLSLERIPERLEILFKQCFHQLYEYNYPFISQWILWIFLCFTLILVLYICSLGDFKRKLARLFLLFASLFATQAAMIIAQRHVIDGRVELFGLVFYEVLVMAVLFTRLKKLHNLSVVAGACVIFASVINDLDALRVWKLGFDAEKMLWNRVLTRLEIQKEFNPTKKYDLILIGSQISMRSRYYTGPRKKFHDRARPLLTFAYNLEGFPGISYEFYYPTRFRGKGFSSFHRNRPDYIARLRRLYQAGVLQKAEVWPKQNGLIVWKDIILIVTDGRELTNYRKKFERELGKK